MSKYDELIKLIESQQTGKENTAVWMVGEQLKEIAAESEHNAELLLQDLKIPAMNLQKAESKIKAYSDKNKGKANCFCVSPKVADGILREFYGLAPRGEGDGNSTPAAEQKNDVFIDLGDFL